MQKLNDELRLLKWKELIDLLYQARYGTSWAWEITRIMHNEYEQISETISEAEGKIIEAFELIAKQMKMEYPNIDNKFIESLIASQPNDEPNPEWIKLENELIDILSEKFYRNCAEVMVEELDMEGLLASFDSEEEMKKLERTYPNGVIKSYEKSYLNKR